MDLGKENWKPPEKSHHLRFPRKHSWFMGMSQNISINMSLEDVDSQSSWEAQDFNEGSYYRFGKRTERTEIRNGALRCDWIAAISW